ncbi:MAG: type II secretion system protein GspN [Thermodesulfovibrionales bacterium]
MKKAILIVCLIVLAVFGSWFIVMPEPFLINLIENALTSENVYLKTEGFRKGFFYSVTVEKILLMKRGDLKRNETGVPGLSVASSQADVPLVILNDVTGKVDLLSVARLNPQLDFESHLQGGRVTGEVDLAGKGAVAMKGNDISIEAIPFLDLIGIRGRGDLSGTFRSGNGQGEITFSVMNAKLKNTSFEGVFLPLEVFHTVYGLVTLRDGTVDVRSFTLQGDGVYARVKGNATGRKLNMDVELMMDSTFQATPILQALVRQYQVSPGYYVIPLKVALPMGNPLIERQAIP